MEDPDSTLAFYTEQLRLLIWSGFFGPVDFQYYMKDVSYDEEASPHLDDLRKFGEAEFTRKREAESSWPDRTDWDRLKDVFDALRQNHVLALHNAGFTRSDAHGGAWDIINRSPRKTWSGYCYYHEQDVEKAVEGMPLYIGYDVVRESNGAREELGNRIATLLRLASFIVDWNGDPDKRLQVTNLDWKKRTDWFQSDPPTDLNSVETIDTSPKPGLLARLFGKSS